jgi:hypothetical protein
MKGIWNKNYPVVVIYALFMKIGDIEFCLN